MEIGSEGLLDASMIWLTKKLQLYYIEIPTFLVKGYKIGPKCHLSWIFFFNGALY
jgi:hypothetical protein